MLRPGQLRRWTDDLMSPLSKGQLFLVLKKNDRTTGWRDDDDAAWTFLAGGAVLWQWEDAILEDSEIISEAVNT